MNKPFIAASSYLNAAPLWYSFLYGEQKSRCTLVSDVAPVRCAQLLAERRAEAALIPVIEYQRQADLLIAPGACVASKTQVYSVVLASRVPLAEVRSVTLDTTSRTSAALVEIIFSRFYNLTPEYRTAPPRIQEMLETSDAALIIGDPAMMIDRRGLHVYDLAEEWRKHTGLPFVFAFWAMRRDAAEMFAPGVERRVDFRGARREGVAHAEELAALYSEQLGMAKSELVSYLTKNIHYDLDDESLSGLKLYYELAHECGLIDDARPLIFCE
ncbi:MAG: menaquinone biosynthetic enzyme MqnA/MqnD family protein [Blastocatellia bacterium]